MIEPLCSLPQHENIKSCEKCLVWDGLSTQATAVVMIIAEPKLTSQYRPDLNLAE